jgi:hypothetical protein
MLLCGNFPWLICIWVAPMDIYICSRSGYYMHATFGDLFICSFYGLFLSPFGGLFLSYIVNPLFLSRYGIFLVM